MTMYNWLILAVVVCSFVGNATYLKGVFAEKFKNCEKRLNDLEDGVRYNDTCITEHKAVDQRLGRLEKKENGKT